MQFTRYSFHSEQPGGQSVAGVTAIYEDRDGVLWLGTLDSGLLKLDRERRQVMRYARQAGNPNSLHDNAVKTLFEDAEGVMWVGTQEGVSRFLKKQLPFVNYRQSPAIRTACTTTRSGPFRGTARDSCGSGRSSVSTGWIERTGQVTSYRHDLKERPQPSRDRVAAIREGRGRRAMVWHLLRRRAQPL